MGVRTKARAPLTASDRALVSALVADVGPRLLAYVRRMCDGRLSDAEDIVAETFCRAASNIDALRSSGRQDLYLLTVARNVCRDGFRRRQPEPMAEEQFSEHPGDRPDPADAVDRGQRTLAMREAMARLPEEFREVVVLRLSSGLKFEEIAELLQIPLGTALSRMHTAIRRLREMLRCEHE